MITERTECDSAMGDILFRCRTRSTRHFLNAINYKFSGPPGVFRTIIRAGEMTMSYLAPWLFAGILCCPLLGLLQWTLGANGVPKVLVLGLFGSALAMGIWWFWISPRQDYLIVYEQGFAWRIWISKWGFWPNRGMASINAVEEFLYRSDSMAEAKTTDSTGLTTPEKLTKILLEISQSRHETILRYKNGTECVVENLLIRFAEEDTRRFLDYIAARTRSTIVAA